MRWFLLTLVLTGVSHNSTSLKSDEKITVGGGVACHYPPDRLNQAIIEHNTLYLTTETVYPPIQINHPKLTLIGGLADCGDWNQLRNHSQKSIITGFHQYRPVTISAADNTANSQIKLVNLRLTHGQADTGGGLHITGPARVVLKNTVIEHNIADQRGGGMVLSGPHVTLQLINSLVQKNAAKKLGGGISCEGDHRIRIEHSQQIDNNQAPLADDYLLDQGCLVKINSVD
ncbi:MAG: hypothetical protein ACK5L8_11435 [Marinicella pacifica]